MCSLSAAMIGLTAAQGYGQYKTQSNQYKAQAMAYDAQAQAAEQNARIADRQREQVADNYAQEQKKLDDRRRLVLGQQAASAGASGLTGGGSVLDAGASAIDAWRQDSMNLLADQRNDAWSAWANQVNYINQGREARVAAANTRSQAKAAKLGTILGTAMSMYGAYKTYGNPFSSGTGETAGSLAGKMNNGFTGSLGKNLGYDTPTFAYQNGFQTAMKSPSYLTGMGKIGQAGIGSWVQTAIPNPVLKRYKYPWEK